MDTYRLKILWWLFTKGNEAQPEAPGLEMEACADITFPVKFPKLYRFRFQHLS